MYPGPQDKRQKSLSRLEKSMSVGTVNTIASCASRPDNEYPGYPETLIQHCCPGMLPGRKAPDHPKDDITSHHMPTAGGGGDFQDGEGALGAAFRPNANAVR